VTRRDDASSVERVVAFGRWNRGNQHRRRIATTTTRAMVDESTADAKRAMRKEISSALRSMSTEELRLANDEMAKRLAVATREAKRCGAYLASARLREPSVDGLIERIIADPDGYVFCPVVDVDEVSGPTMRMLRVEDVERDTHVGAYDLREPTERAEDGSLRDDAIRDIERVGVLDAIIVPGVAFDARGRRLGRGGGYYDAFLEKYEAAAVAMRRPPPLVIALAYNCQFIGDRDVPVDAHDRLVDVIVTPLKTYGATERGRAVIQ
jgi:5-formyltetrahydrofolate cyclo-ligase